MSTRPAFTRPFLAWYRRVYDTLIDLDIACARLRRRRRQIRAIQAALPVIGEHRARSFLGRTLRHRHFRAEPNVCCSHPRTGIGHSSHVKDRHVGKT